MRYVEEVNKIRVVRLWVDYAIDTNSQMWFVNCGGCVTSSKDLRAISSRSKGSMVHATGAVATGRSGFLGKAGETMEQEEVRDIDSRSDKLRERNLGELMDCADNSVLTLSIYPDVQLATLVAARKGSDGCNYQPEPS